MDSPPPAPLLGQDLPVELMNTVWADRHGRYDALGSIPEAAGWLAAVSPRLDPALSAVADELSTDAVGQLRELRDAMRRIAADITADPRERAASPTPDTGTALEALNRSSARASSWPVLEVDADGTVTRRLRTSGSTEDLLVATLAADGVAFFSRWGDTDLRACLAPGCVLYFVKDHPRREWCSAGCGNRARAARHYSRHGRRGTAPA